MSWNIHEFDLTIPDEMRGTITSFLYGALGFLSSFLIEWYKKRKSPKEENIDISGRIVTAAKENVETAKSLIDVLDERLQQERKYFEDKIEQSKKDCEEKISDLKEKYDKILSDAQTKNDEEKRELSQKITQLQIDKEVLQKQVEELTERLRKYENGVK